MSWNAREQIRDGSVISSDLSNGSVTNDKIAADAVTYDNLAAGAPHLTITVAANNSSAKAKATADYVCDGTDDHVQIQAAIDAISGSTAAKGTVLLAAGSYVLGAASTRISGTGNLDSYGSYTSKLDVGSDHASFAVGDPVILTGGDNGGNTLEQHYNEAICYVVAVSGGTLGATEIELSHLQPGAYTGVTYIRPAYSIRLPRYVSLEGEGFNMTYLSMAANSNCFGIEVYGTGGDGAQQLRKFTIHGNYGNQNPTNALEASLICNCNGFDTHIRDVEIRYAYGVGLIVSQGWGFQMQGSWIENCYRGQIKAVGGRFTNVKIMAGEQSVPTIDIMPNYSSNGPWFCNCEIACDSTGTYPIRVRRSLYGVQVVGGRLMSSHATNSLIRVESVGPSAVTSGGIIVIGARLSAGNASGGSVFDSAAAITVAGLHIDGILTSSNTSVITSTSVVKCPSVNVTGSTGYVASPGRMDTLAGFYNGSGASLAASTLASAKQDASNVYAVTAASLINDPGFLGSVAETAASAANMSVQSFGPGLAYVSGGTDNKNRVIRLGDWLSVGREPLGTDCEITLQRAAPGDTVVAFYLDTAYTSINKGARKVFFVPPRKWDSVDCVLNYDGASNNYDFADGAEVAVAKVAAYIPPGKYMLEWAHLELLDGDMTGLADPGADAHINIAVGTTAPAGTDSALTGAATISNIIPVTNLTIGNDQTLSVSNTTPAIITIANETANCIYVSVGVTDAQTTGAATLDFQASLTVKLKRVDWLTWN